MTVDLTSKIAREREVAKRNLEKQGLVLPPKPVYDLPKLPQRITEWDDDRLMKLFVRFTQYQDHLAGLLVESEIDEQSAETLLEVAKARFLAQSWTGASDERVAVEKAKGTMDEEVRKCTSAVTQCKAKRKMYSVLFESLNRQAAVISRELSRRIGRDSGERRTDRWTP